MTSGIEGTGPYSKLKNLQTLANQYSYELNLIKQGVKGKRFKKFYEERRQDIKAQIKKLRASIKNPPN